VLRFLKTTTFRVIAIIAALIALYAIAGFVIAPKLVRSALLKDIPETLGVTPAVGEIHINPFLFQVTVDDFSLTGSGGEKLLGFQRLFVDFELSSIWHRAYSFANIDITSPYVSAVMGQNGSLNLLQLQPKPEPEPRPKPAEKSEPLPAIRIGSFKVSQGLVTYEDRSRPDVFAARLEPINFELREFTTGVEGGKFTFTGSSKLGERIEWHGHLSVQPIESDGEVQINGLLVHTLWEYLQDRLNFVVNSGTIDLAATYRFSLQDGAAAGGGPANGGPTNGGPANLQVDVSKVALSDLTVQPKGSGTEPLAPWITVPALTVTGTTVDLSKRQAHVDLVSLTGVKLVTWLEADGSVNLMKLAAAPGSPNPGSPNTAAPGNEPATPPAPAPPTLTATNSAPAGAAPPWAFDVRQFELRDASISTEDRSVHPAVKLVLAPFSLQVNGASQDLTKPVSVTLDTRVNEAGSLTARGEVTPQPVMANLSFKLADIDLTAVQPYIAQHTSMTLRGGKLGGEGKLHYGTEKNMPAVQFAGNINVEKLHTVDDALHDDFINWDRLDLLGLSYSQGPDRLDIEQIVARKLYARVIIEKDASLNVKRVLMAPGATVAGPATAPAAAAASSTAATEPAMHRTAGRRSQGDRKRVVTASQAAATAPASQGIPMSIKKIVVQASQANFADLSVTPNFSTGIQKLDGTVLGLSSKPKSRAKVDLHGSVGEFSPVSITGEVNVLGPLYTDLALSFRNMELTIFNPYSGKFAGYNITKGKLTTELHYKVDGRKLDAQHHIVVDQLEFGDKTASKDAVSLPIKLAVSLLKDRNGVIDLDIPVTGSLDDPKFRLAPIIWKVFVNILEKAVTAPFALLGSLFGGGPDIQFIDFQPGISTLDAAAVNKVKTVAKALIERPQLKIDVPIAVVSDIDRPALIAAQFNEQLGTEQTSAGAPKKAKAPAAAAVPLPPDQLDPTIQLELLTRLYSKDFGAAPRYPEAVTSIKSKPEATAAKVDFLNKAIREHIVVGDAELKALGQQRALALQQALLSDPQVTAERVFLVANDKATAKDGLVRLELSLK
jgi:Domain of Unknown Function (DUF748)